MIGAIPYACYAYHMPAEVRCQDKSNPHSVSEQTNVDSIFTLVDHLEQWAENLALTEQPDQEAIQELRKVVVQLANLGAMTASVGELDELNQDIVDLFLEDDEVVFEWHQSLLVPQEWSPAFGPFNQRHILHTGLWKKIKHAAHKVEKFLRKHKKEIIIGAAAALAIGVAAFVIVEAVGGATAAAGAAAASASSDHEKEQEHESSQEVIASLPSEVRDSKLLESQANRSRDTDVMQAALERGGRMAKEQRYPNLAFPQEQMEAVKLNAENAWNHFTENMADELANHWLDHTVDAGEVIGGLSVAAKLGPTVGGVLAVLTAIKGSADFISKQKENIEKLYQPVGMVYKQLHDMEEANKVASCDRCEKENYQPSLQFHPNPSQADPGKSSLVDLNNPSSPEIVVVLP